MLKQLNREQCQAVQHQQDPAVVLAGAGSGKTRVLTTRAAWLIQQQQLNPEEVLLVTFTNKAAGEMNKRVFDLTNQQLPFSGTFHSLCARILRRDGQQLQLDPNFTIYDSTDQRALIKQLYQKHKFDQKKHPLNKTRALISQAKNEMLSPNQYQELATGFHQEFAAQVYQLYQQALKDQQAVDFDDLLLLTVKLLKNQSQIRKKYQQLFSHVLVDEYQDTNKAQYQLTKIFAQPQNNLFVVGDFSQSIYAWRGADYRNLFYLKQDFPQLTEYRLEQNYRSSQTILDAATQVIKKNSSHPILELWTDQPAQDKIKLLENSNNNQEAQAVVSLIQDYQIQYAYQDMAILYRTNAQSRAFEEALMTKGIPYRIVGGIKFYERAEIKDVLAYLKVATNPADTVSKERITKLGKRRLAKFQDWLTQQTANQAINQLQPQQPPLAVLKEILTVTDYLAKYDAQDPQDQARLENVQELLNVAAQFDDLVTFLQSVALVQNDYLAHQSWQPEPDRVTLMSLHAAKGLEFAVVFMVGMEEGLLPHSRSSWDKEQLEEERRLCYVGITRAKKHLVLSYAKKRWQYGNTSKSTPSRFISDINEELLEIPRHCQFYQQTPSAKKQRIIDNQDLDDFLADDLDARSFLET
ncbi:MAG: AAA family ATPase [Candidatus Pacebacteria bacterium]|nr:AAA family ATPase [Candidatus Paceibacterota bacterium]